MSDRRAQLRVTVEDLMSNAQGLLADVLPTVTMNCHQETVLQVCHFSTLQSHVTDYISESYTYTCTHQLYNHKHLLMCTVLKQIPLQ